MPEMHPAVREAAQAQTLSYSQQQLDPTYTPVRMPIFPCAFRELQQILPAVLPERQLFALLSVFSSADATARPRYLVHCYVL